MAEVVSIALGTDSTQIERFAADEQMAYAGEMTGGEIGVVKSISVSTTTATEP